MIRAAAVALVLLLASLVIACGGGGGGGAPAGSTTVTMNEFKFAPSSLTAKAGSTTFFLVNSGSTSHDMVITDSAGKQIGKSDLVQPGNSATFTVTLTAGAFTILCDQPGHREAGMEGTLTVA